MQEAAQLAVEGGVPIWYEPVSGPKAARAAAALHMLDYISPNASELVSISKALENTRQQPRRTPGTAHYRASRGRSIAVDHAKFGSSEMLHLPSSMPLPVSRQIGTGAGLRSPHAARDRSGLGHPSSAEGSPEINNSGGHCGAGMATEARNAVERLRPHLRAVLRAGVKRVVLTLGRLGAALCTLR